MNERKKILLLAGDELAIPVKRVLELKGYEIVISKSKGFHMDFCEEVRAELTHEKFDMVISANFADFTPSSIIMIIPVIRKFDPNIKIFGMSGYVDSDFMEKFNNLGIDGFLLTPTDLQNIVSRIEEIFIK